MDNFIHHPQDVVGLFQRLSALRININEEVRSKGFLECDHYKLFAWIDEFKEKLEEARLHEYGRKKEVPTEKGRAKENTRKRRRTPRK